MPRMKKQPAPRPVPLVPVAANGPASDVLTLAEAAAYLRLTESDDCPRHRKDFRKVPGLRIVNWVN